VGEPSRCLLCPLSRANPAPSAILSVRPWKADIRGVSTKSPYDGQGRVGRPAMERRAFRAIDAGVSRSPCGKLERLLAQAVTQSHDLVTWGHRLRTPWHKSVTGDLQRAVSR
jgi:hypothetical protein